MYHLTTESLKHLLGQRIRAQPQGLALCVKFQEQAGLAGFDVVFNATDRRDGCELFLDIPSGCCQQFIVRSPQLNTKCVYRSSPAGDTEGAHTFRQASAAFPLVGKGIDIVWGVRCQFYRDSAGLVTSGKYLQVGNAGFCVDVGALDELLIHLMSFLLKSKQGGMSQAKTGVGFHADVRPDCVARYVRKKTGLDGTVKRHRHNQGKQRKK